MLFMWRKPKAIDALEQELNVRNFNRRIVENRGKFRILVIDDKAFTPLDNLTRNNYDLTHVKDIDSIERVQKYPIVLCDLAGVGLALNPSMQGAHLIREIKKNYPEKVVIAYTGGGLTPLVEQSIVVSDQYLKKDANIEEWCEALDKAIADLANPVIVWRKLRHRLLDAGINPYDLSVLEDTFVKNVLEGREIYEPALLRKADELKLGGHIKSIIQSLIGSALFELLKSG